MKTCSKCNISKEETEFYFTNKKHDKLKARCKACTKIDKHEYYIKNKDTIIPKVQIRNNRWALWLQNKKENLKCIKCGEDFGPCIDFHHRDPSEKEYSISSMIGRGWPFWKIEKEMEKCDVLCANCHRKLHWKLKYETTE